MNKKLKSKIFERFGTQYDFSRAVDVHESVVSRVVQGRRTLTEIERQEWADLLEADSAELFGEEAEHVQN
jgi:plasmid maintenance system antidote protein VapI